MSSQDRLRAARMMTAWLLVVLGIAHCAPSPAPRHAMGDPQCYPLGASNDPDALQGARAVNAATVVVAGGTLFACPCGGTRGVRGDVEARSVHGAAEERSVQGDTEDRGLRGRTEDRGVRGATENRSVRGDAEDRGVRGATESRATRGETENRGVRGDTESRSVRAAAPSLTCTSSPDCAGFVVHGAHVTHWLDGERFAPVASSCVDPSP